MPGRPPKPTSLKLLQGNPGKRPLNDREPAAKIGRPKRPAWVAKDARRHWAQAMTTLEAMGVLTVADGPAVALMANALAEYIDAADDVEKYGLVIEDRHYDKQGNLLSESLKANPAAATRADAWRRVNLMLQQFGMTASSRAKVKAEKPPDKNEFEKLFGS